MAHVWLRTARWLVLSSLSLRGRRQLRRRIKRWPALLCAVLVAGFLLYLGLWAPFAMSNWVGDSGIRRQAMGAEPLTYDDVRSEPDKHTGKTVRWHVLRRGEQWYYEGDGGRPIEWASAPPERITDSHHTMAVVATVVAPKAVDDFTGELLASLEHGDDAVFSDQAAKRGSSPALSTVRLRYEGLD